MGSGEAPATYRRAAPPSTLDTHPSAASIVVRPDMLVVPFALRAIASEPDAALALIEQTLRTAITPRFGELAPSGAMRIRMRGSQVDRLVHGAPPKKTMAASKSTSSSKKDSEATGGSSEEVVVFAVALQGTIEYALAPSQDYWERARLITRIDGLREKIVAASLLESSAYEASIEAPHVGVRDPEAVRTELLNRWVAKRKQFAREAKSADLAVAIDACRPPSDIVVHALSLEEVELTLPIDCAHPAPPPPAPATMATHLGR